MGVRRRAVSALILLGLATNCADTHCRRKADVGNAVTPVEAETTNVKAPTSVVTVLVYKYDGSLQCQGGKGVPLEKMAAELKEIPILSQKKKRDGLMHIQVCGSATGMANVFEIPERNFPQAEKLGFKKWNFE